MHSLICVQRSRERSRFTACCPLHDREPYDSTAQRRESVGGGQEAASLTERTRGGERPRNEGERQMKRTVRRDEEITDEEQAAAMTSTIQPENDDLPDCSCGWSGKGTGPDGQFVKGDKCPVCGESLR